jgi:homoserine kinase
VAGAIAANTLLDLGLTPEALLELGTEIEGHPDNVAPAVYGGACMVLHRPGGGLLAVPIEIHAALAFVFAIPDLRVETRRARAALPADIPHATAVQAAARGAALIHGLATADPDSLSVGLDDLLHVPYRRSLVTGYDAVTASARAAGAYGATLSGSGPTVVAPTTPARAAAVAEAMIRAWEEIEVTAETFVQTAPRPR